MRRNLWTAAAVFVLFSVLLMGCSTKREPCYGLVDANPSTQTAIIFDACRGAVFYQTLPPPSTPNAQGEY